MLLSANPLVDVSHTRVGPGVMARGRWFTQAELDHLVEVYVASYRGSGS